jgi:hypothetical protein
MLVVRAPERRDHMLAALAECAPTAEVEVVDQMLDALTRAMRGQSQLMVIDVSLERPLAPAMRRYLKRTAPKVRVHLYDSLGDPVPSPSLDSTTDSAGLSTPTDRTAEANDELRATLHAWLSSPPPDAVPTESPADSLEKGGFRHGDR